ncbi:DUF1570 domain-containing protein [Tundrisphaera lichenicola]|uniref:DUF1570 domain-containing protein n=1 Tax=Tundrisphaera lichenicola TaxID=2029860 RepID=UPI003EBAC4B0
MTRIDRPSWFRGLLKSWPALVALIGGCATLIPKDGPPLVPASNPIQAGPYLIRTNSKLEADAPVVRQLLALDSQVEQTLGLRADIGDHPVEVYILDDRQAFEHFLTFYYPELPHRRAFFLANGNQRVIYTFFGDRLEEDLRHEATHALLHVAIGDIPLWLDEGLAEYFENPTDRQGLNPEHMGRIPGDLAEGWTPDLGRLEALRSVRQMSPRDYRESWAWVHFLLNDDRSNKAALLAYLADLRTQPEARPLSSRLEDAGASTLIAHLGQVREAPVAVSVPILRDPTIRLQSGPVETPPPVKRRGFFGRFRDLFGS